MSPVLCPSQVPCGTQEFCSEEPHRWEVSPPLHASTFTSPNSLHRRIQPQHKTELLWSHTSPWGQCKTRDPGWPEGAGLHTRAPVPTLCPEPPLLEPSIVQQWQSAPHHFTDSNPETLRLRAWHRVTSKLATRACGEARAGPSFLPSRLVALLSQRGLTVHLCHLACLLGSFHRNPWPLDDRSAGRPPRLPWPPLQAPRPLQQLLPALQTARSNMSSSCQRRASLPRTPANDTSKHCLEAHPSFPSALPQPGPTQP